VLVLQFGDLQGLLTNRTAGATLYGATQAEKATVLAGKAAHYGLLLGLPTLLHGPTSALTGLAAYTVMQVGHCTTAIGDAARDGSRRFCSAHQLQPSP